MAGGLPDITVSFPGGKKVDAQFAHYTVKTDQPVRDGGDGTAPAPFMVFLSALATCAGIYVLGFCQARGIDTEGLSITQSHQFGMGPDGKPRLSDVAIRIEVPPGFPERHHDTLVRVAEMCAVKKVIEDPPAFLVETVIKEG